MSTQTQAGKAPGDTTLSTTQAIPTALRGGRALVPRVDVLEDPQGITLLADLPGVAREQLSLNVDGDTLWIEGALATIAPEGWQASHVEVRVPRYRRAFTLSRELDTSRIEAHLKDGVLNLRIPRQAHAQPRRIEVQVH